MLKKLLLAAGIASLASLPAQAIVVTGQVTGGSALAAGGTFVELDGNATFSVGQDNHQSNNLFAFNESQNVTFATDLDYQYGADNAIGGGVNYNSGTLTGGTGEQFASHYVFFDPGPVRSISGWVEFDADIAAVFTTRDDLIASDVFISPGNNVNYLSPGLRGLEGVDHPLDVVGNRVYINFQAASPGDYIRVLTRQSPGAETPEASTWAVMLMGFLMLITAGRRRQH